MERIFPHALVACIAEGRSPHTGEFEEIMSRLLREALAGRPLAEARRLAKAMADMAFHGRCALC